MYISPSLTKKITCLTKEWRLTLVVVTSFAEKLNLDPLHREVLSFHSTNPIIGDNITVLF